MSARSFTPTSTGLVSVPAVGVALVQRLHGQVGVANDQPSAAAIGLPARSLAALSVAL